MFCKSGQENDLDIQICSSIRAVDQGDWEALIPDSNIFLSLPYLKILENDNRYGMEFRYALIYRKDRPVAAAYFQIVDFSGEELRPYIPQNTKNGTLQKINTKFQSLLETGLSRINWKLMVSGNIFATGECGFHYLPDLITTKEAYAVLKEVMELISEDAAEDRKVNVFLIKDFYEQQTIGEASLIRNNFRKLIIESDMFLHVDPEWKEFSDYMDSISSKYRVRARKVFKKSKVLERKELSLDEIRLRSDEIHTLYMNVAAKANFNLAYLAPGYFYDVKLAFGTHFKVIGYFLESEMVGFISNFIAGGELDVHFVGLDYDFNRKYATYQRILYDDIRLAIEHRLLRIHFGRTAQEIKSTVGARPKEMFGYLKHKSTFPNLLIKPLSSYLKPQDWIVRNPFKTGSVSPA